MEARVLAEGKKGRRRVHLVRWALLMLGGGVAALVVLAVQEPAGQVRRLPDGSTLELRGWTVPPDHLFVDGKLWQQALLRLPWEVPWVGGFRGRHPSQQELFVARWVALVRGPAPAVPAPASTDPLVLWFRRAGKTNRLGASAPAWIDEHGCRFPTERMWQPFQLEEVVSETETSQGNWMRNWLRWKVRSTVVPRRGRGPLTYALLPLSPSKPSTSPTHFSVPRSSVAASYPVRQADPLPIRVTRGETTFALEKLERLPEKSRLFDTCTATFRYSGRQAGKQRWRPEQILVSDATGNQLVETPPPGARSERVPFSALCYGEAAWKLRVWFTPSDPTSAPPRSVWKIRDLLVPPLGQSAKPNLRWAAVDLQLRVDGVGQGPFGPQCVFNSLPAIHLSGFAAAPCNVTLLETGIPGGTGWQETVRTQGVEPGKVDLCFPVLQFERARRIDLSLLIHPTPTVEFLVNPP